MPWVIVFLIALYVTEPWSTNYATFDATDEGFLVEVSGYYGFRGERNEFTHIIECRKVIYGGLNDYGREEWRYNNRIFTSSQDDGSVVMYGVLAPVDGDPDAKYRNIGTCGLLVENPEAIFTAAMDMVWIDSAYKPRRVLQSNLIDRPYPMAGELISPGLVQVKRISRGNLDPVDPMVHWAHLMMANSKRGTLAGSHEGYLDGRPLLGGFRVSCVSKSEVDIAINSKDASSTKKAAVVPSVFVDDLCDYLTKNTRSFASILPNETDEFVLEVDPTNPDLTWFFADPELVNEYARGERKFIFHFKEWRIDIEDRMVNRGMMCYIDSQLCIHFERYFLSVPKPLIMQIQER